MNKPFRPLQPDSKPPDIITGPSCSRCRRRPAFGRQKRPPIKEKKLGSPLLRRSPLVRIPTSTREQTNNQRNRLKWPQHLTCRSTRSSRKIRPAAAGVGVDVGAQRCAGAGARPGMPCNRFGFGDRKSFFCSRGGSASRGRGTGRGGARVGRGAGKGRFRQRVAQTYDDYGDGFGYAPVQRQRGTKIRVTPIQPGFVRAWLA
jgi:hypothetical protein